MTRDGTFLVEDGRIVGAGPEPALHAELPRRDRRDRGGLAGAQDAQGVPRRCGRAGRAHRRLDVHGHDRALTSRARDGAAGRIGHLRPPFTMSRSSHRGRGRLARLARNHGRRGRPSRRRAVQDAELPRPMSIVTSYRLDRSLTLHDPDDRIAATLGPRDEIVVTTSTMRRTSPPGRRWRRSRRHVHQVDIRRTT